MTNPKNWAPLASRGVHLFKPGQQQFQRTAPVPGLGAIRFRLHELAQERGLVIAKGRYAGKANRAQIRRMTGVSDDALFYMLRYPHTIKQIHFRALARLCHGLGCQPGDLLVYDRTEDSATPLSETYKQTPDSSGLDQ
jgi:DNA-binding Xre family transcriptional regulator